MTNLALLFAMLGVVGAATLVMALVANIVADVTSSNRLKRERRIWR